MARLRSKFGMAAGIAGLMAAGAAGPVAADSGPDRLKQRDDCPQEGIAAINIPNLLDARKSGNESSATDETGKRALKAKPRRKGPARKKTMKKAVKKTAKKAAKKRRLKKPALKARKKAAKRRTARRNPC